jgi:uncharacterized protein YndB with AHSA1/START domain
VQERGKAAESLAVESGCLLIADISGYTGYVVESPLAYAEDVLSDLTETVAGQLGRLFRLNKREGDAVFGFALDGEIDGTMLLDAIDDCYFAFRAKVEGIGHATSCGCSACTKLPDLGLKFVAHRGEFIRRAGASGEELTGQDVILAHRLLKNAVAETHGTIGYALLTGALVDALELDPERLGLHRHHESYEHVGEVPAFVLDLDERRREILERRRVIVTEAEAEFEVEALLPALPPVTWEYLTAPDKRCLWSGESITETTPDGRRDTGATNFCVDGRREVYEEILDWRPFGYFTERRSLGRSASLVLTTVLEPHGDGTRVVTRGATEGSSIARRRGRRGIVGELEEGYRRIAALLAQTSAD